MVAQDFFAARVSGTAGGTVVRTWVNPIGADPTAWGTPDWTSSVNPGGDAADSGQAIGLPQVRTVAAARGDGPVFFEVPNSLYTLRDLGIWDVIYEHCSYFTAPSLARLFGEAGFRVAETGETYGGQFLTLHGTVGEPGQARASAAEIGAIANRVGAFAGHQRSKVAEWNERLASWLAEGRKPAIWGAGSKGVTFLNTLELGSRVLCAIDINERKHGRFVPGSGQEVVPPERAVELGADVVLIMNPLYRDEIRQQQE